MRGRQTQKGKNGKTPLPSFCASLWMSEAVVEFVKVRLPVLVVHPHEPCTRLTLATRRADGERFRRWVVDAVSPRFCPTAARGLHEDRHRTKGCLRLPYSHLLRMTSVRTNPKTRAGYGRCLPRISTAQSTGVALGGRGRSSLPSRLPLHHALVGDYGGYVCRNPVTLTSTCGFRPANVQASAWGHCVLARCAAWRVWIG